MPSVAGLAGFAVADAVGQDDEVFRRVERLAGAEQFTAEGLRSEGAAGAPVPCRIITALRITPEASRCGVPIVR